MGENDSMALQPGIWKITWDGSGGWINRKISVHLLSDCKLLSAGKISFNC